MTKQDSHEEQHEMFGDTVDGSVQQMLNHIDEITEDDLKALWPHRLFEFYEIISYELNNVANIQKDDNLKISAALVTAIANYFGGTSFYLPHNEKLDRAIRDIKIWNEFKGNNLTQLTRKYRCSEMTIRSAIAKQYALRHKKLQPSLF